MTRNDLEALKEVVGSALTIDPTSFPEKGLIPPDLLYSIYLSLIDEIEDIFNKIKDAPHGEELSALLSKLIDRSVKLRATHLLSPPHENEKATAS